VRRPQKFHLAKPKKGGGGIDRWLALLILAVIIFAVWKFSRPAKSAKPVKPPPGIPVLAPAEITKVRVVVPVVATPVIPVKTNAAVQTIPTGPVKPADSARRTHDLLEAQVVLARTGISCGSLDGVIGSQTRAAIRAFQRQQHFPETGELNPDTRAGLLLDAPALTSYTVTSNDLARLQPLSKSWLGKSQQSALDFETVLELVAEKSHAHPNLIRRLNPGFNWTNVVAGATLIVPDAAYPEPETKAAFVVISLSEKTLEAFDAATNLLAHFPCSIAKRVEKRPVGELHVVAVATNPNYTFDPEVFPEVPEAKEIGHKLILPPGPNNPVGAVWISLDKTGYGMHGTPKPEEVGRTESHGCFRLANWNAEYLLKLAWVGMPVRVEP
jgi:lipoprotein-anchoring transpeptidase ErfK/SrfK